MGEMTLERGMMPECLREDRCFPGNSKYEVRVESVKREILDLAKLIEIPWHVEFSRRYAYGESMTAICKDLNRSKKTGARILKTWNIQQLVQYYASLKEVEEGPSKSIRKDMLYEVAINNQAKDPKETIKAIAEMNKMDQENIGSGGGKAIEIHITTNITRGGIDG